MPKPTKGPRMGGSPSHERLMMSNLATSLFEHGQITTTEARAKRVQPLAEKLISKARRGDLASRRLVLKVVRSRSVVARLFEEIAPEIDAAREGGCTRIVKLPARQGDNAPMALIEIITEKVEKKKKAKPVAKKAPAKVAQAKAEEAKAEETAEEAKAEEAKAEETVEVAEAKAEEKAEDK